MTYNSRTNQVEIEPLNLSVSSESNQNVEIEVRTNAVFSGLTNFVSAGNNLVSDIDTTANTVSGGTLLAAFTIGSKGSLNVDLRSIEITVPPSLTFTISARVISGNASAVTATLTYYEDI
jgi:flagellar capping protein FliD